MLEPFQEANFGAIAFRFVLGIFVEFHVGLIVVEDVFYQYVFVCLVFFEHIPERVTSFADSNSLLLHQELFNAHILCSQTGRLSYVYFGDLPHFLNAVKFSHEDFVSREHVFEAMSERD